MSITIRLMSFDDIDVVAPAIARAFNTVNARYGYPPDFPDPHVATLMSRYYYSRDPDGCIVAERDGAILGSIFARRRGDRVTIGPVTVDTASQAGGVGRRMMEALFDLYPDAAFCLSQAAFNKESFSLYSRTGFVAVEQMLRLDRPIAPVTSEDDDPNVRGATADDAPSVVDLDRRLSNAEREREIETLFGTGRVYVCDDGSGVQGYLASLATPGPVYLGPAVAHDEAQIGALVRAAVRAAGSRSCTIHLPARFTPLIHECFRLGFRLFCINTFMVRGEWRTPEAFYLHALFPEAY